MFIALTGGIAAGKSTALSILEENEIRCFDTDLMVHELYQNSDILRKQLFRRWNISLELKPTEIRRKVADIVFADVDQLHWLESVIHPLIVERLSTLRNETDKLTVCAVPLLFEIGLETCFDLVVTVSCPKNIQYKRLCERGWSNAEIKARLDRQFTMTKKEELADLVLGNIGDLDFLISQCNQMIKSWKSFPVQN